MSARWRRRRSQPHSSASGYAPGRSHPPCGSSYSACARSRVQAGGLAHGDQGADRSRGCRAGGRPVVGLCRDRTCLCPNAPCRGRHAWHAGLAPVAIAVSVAIAATLTVEGARVAPVALPLDRESLFTISWGLVAAPLPPPPARPERCSGAGCRPGAGASSGGPGSKRTAREDQLRQARMAKRQSRSMYARN